MVTTKPSNISSGDMPKLSKRYIAKVEKVLREKYLSSFDPSKKSGECDIPATIYREFMNEATSICSLLRLSIKRDKNAILFYMQADAPGGLAKDTLTAVSGKISSVLLLGNELKNASIQTIGLGGYLMKRWKNDQQGLLKDLFLLFSSYTDENLDGDLLDGTQTCFFGDKDQVFHTSFERIISFVYQLIYGDEYDVSLRRKTNLVFSYVSMSCLSNNRETVIGKKACIEFCTKHQISLGNFLLHVSKQFVSNSTNRFSLREKITSIYHDRIFILDIEEVLALIATQYGVTDIDEQEMILLYLATQAKNRSIKYYDSDLLAHRLMLVDYAQTGLQELLAAT